MPAGSRSSGASGIYVSFRGDDAGGYAREVCNRLIELFGHGQVRASAAATQPGADAARAQQEVASSEVLLAMIGQSWLSAAGPGGSRAIDDPADPVRTEIRTALQSGVIVIPVLVQGARPPGLDELPADIRDLARFSGVELADGRWSADLGGLLSFVYGTVRDARATDPHATDQLPPPPPALTPTFTTAPGQVAAGPPAPGPPAPAPPSPAPPPVPAGVPAWAGAPLPAPPGPGPRQRRGTRGWALAGGVAAALAAVAVGLAVLLSGGGTTPAASQSPVSTPAPPPTAGSSPASTPTASPSPTASGQQVDDDFIAACEGALRGNVDCRCAMEKISAEGGDALGDLTERLNRGDITATGEVAARSFGC